MDELVVVMREGWVIGGHPLPKCMVCYGVVLALLLSYVYIMINDEHLKQS